MRAVVWCLAGLLAASCAEKAETIPFKQAASKTSDGHRVVVTGQLAFPYRGATVSRGRSTLRLHADAQFAEPSFLVELPVGDGADTVDAPPGTFIVAGVRGRRHDGAPFTSADRVTLTGVVRFVTIEGERGPVAMLEGVARIDAP